MTDNVPDMPHFAIVAYEGVQQSAVHGLAELFDVANGFAAKETGRQISHSKLNVPIAGDASRFDAVILPPNLKGARGTKDYDLHRWIRDQHFSGAVLCSACAGGFWLGHAGVLDGRAATTHWALEADFKDTFPSVKLNPERILLDDNEIVTAGGVMAWVDLGIHLISRWLGPTVVSLTCRQMLIDPTGREQRNYRSFRPNMAHADQLIRTLQIWMESNFKHDMSVKELARQTGISERSLHRRFSRNTGLTINRYAQELRIEKAKGMLEHTALPVSEVCWQVGFQDISAFSRLFKSITGLSPGEHRQRFQIKPGNPIGE